MRKFIIYFVVSRKYVVYFHTGKPQATATNSENGVLEEIAATGASAAYNFANFVLDGCELTHAKAYLKKVENIGDGVGFVYAFKTKSSSRGRFANAKDATPQSCRMFKKTRIQ